MGISELYIVKRDGKRKAFSVEKIKRAVRKAFLSVGSYATDDDITSILSRVHVSDGMSVDEGVRAAVDAVKALSLSIRIPQRLHELGVREEDIPALAVAAFNDVCTGGNPRPTSVEEIERLYHIAY